jgi:hypothetical protein
MDSQASGKITDATQHEEFISLWIRIQDVHLQPQVQRVHQMALDSNRRVLHKVGLENNLFWKAK